MKIGFISDELHADILTAAQSAAAMGLNTIEIRGMNGKGIPFFSSEEMETVCRTLEICPMTVSAICPGLLRGALDKADDEQEHFETALDFAVRVGAPKVIISSVHRHPNDVRGDYRRIIDYLERYLIMAQNKGLTLCLSNERLFFADMPDNICRFFKLLGEKGLRFCWDPASFYDCGATEHTEFLQTVLPYLEHLYARDVSRSHSWNRLGEGITPWEPILAALAESKPELDISLFSCAGGSLRQEGLQENLKVLQGFLGLA